MEISKLFVCAMGMGVTFVGLSCIILLTTLMGKILQSMAEPSKAPSTPTAVPAAAPAPIVSLDGISEEVKVAILAALAQQPGMDFSRTASITIRRA